MIDYMRGCSWIPPIWALIIASSVVLGYCNTLKFQILACLVDSKYPYRAFPSVIDRI